MAHEVIVYINPRDELIFDATQLAAWMARVLPQIKYDPRRAAATLAEMIIGGAGGE